MRIALFLAPAALVVVSSFAAADPAVSDVDGAASRLTTVLIAGDAQQLGAMFAAKVKIEKVKFTDRACDKAFGQRKRRTITKGKLAQLAACLASADWRPDADSAVALTSDGAEYALDRRRKLHVTFAPRKDGAVQITRLSMIETKLKVTEIVQPVKIEKQYVEPIDGSESDDGLDGGADGWADGWAGDAGGVVGGVADAPPPPPPAAPQNVAPTAVEANRIAGDKMITPEDKTKEDIQKSGKTKIVATFKMCLDVAGNVATVTQLKSTGFPDYDAKLKAGIKTWRYRPYMVNGAAAPVCTAVTFIYSQK